MSEWDDPEALSREELLQVVRLQRRRYRLAVSFMNSMDIWDSFLKWVELKNIRIGD
jgi:hypothetical protein